jgi:hypothetical protein
MVRIELSAMNSTMSGRAAASTISPGTNGTTDRMAADSFVTLATLNNVTNASLSDLLVPHGSIV